MGDVAQCRINPLYEGLNTAERRHPAAQRKRHDIERMLQHAVNEIDGQ